MEKINKTRCFEYVLKCLLMWHKEVTGSKENDLSILKVMKVLFFVCAVREDSIILENVFNNFYAMAYGHVEKDILETIKNTGGVLSCYTIDARQVTAANNAISFKDVSEEIKDDINASIQALKSKNPKMITLSQFDLVKLSHAWYSWQHFYDQAKRDGTFAAFIPTSFIKNEDKVYDLGVF
jgi:hypothetical protein